MRHYLPLFLIAGLAACAEEPAGGPMYESAAADRRTIEVSVRSAGVVEPRAMGEVKSKASGEVLDGLVEVGDHVQVGQPLFIVKVKKMFNKVPAPFAGTITERLMAGKDGTVVAKGQPIFRIDPDERVEEESEESRDARMREATLALL